MKCTDGFSVVEMLVYSSLSLFFVLLVLQFFSSYQRTVARSSSSALYVLSLNAALDSMMRDCASAPSDVRKWHSLQPELITWKTRQGIVGFSFVNSRLVKVCKKINRAGKLHATSYSTLINGVWGQFTLVQNQNQVVAIIISLQARSRDQIHSIHKTVYLREGVVCE